MASKRDHPATIVSGTAHFARKLLMSEYFALILSVVYFLVIACIVPSMFSVRNMQNIFSNMWPLFTVAIGQTFVLLLGGIDLSQSSIMSLTSVMGTIFICRSANPDTLGTSPLWGWFLTENGGDVGRSCPGHSADTPFKAVQCPAKIYRSGTGGVEVLCQTVKLFDE